MLATRQRMSAPQFRQSAASQSRLARPAGNRAINLISITALRAPVLCEPGQRRSSRRSALSGFVRGCVELDMRMSRPAETSFRHCLELSPGNLDAKNRLEAAQRDGRSIMGFLCRLIPGR